MNLHTADWVIVAVFVIALTALAVFTKRYTKSVSDFLVANRCAGRYLISISSGIAGIGVISFLGIFQMYYKAGFTAGWWSTMGTPVSILVILSELLTVAICSTLFSLQIGVIARVQPLW